MAQSANETTKAIRYPSFIPLLLGWTLLGSLACIRHILLYKVPHTHIARDLSDWLTCYLPWVLLSPLVFRLERGFPLNRTHWCKHAALQLGAGLAISLVRCNSRRDFHARAARIWRACFRSGSLVENLEQRIPL